MVDERTAIRCIVLGRVGKGMLVFWCINKFWYTVIPEPFGCAVWDGVVDRGMLVRYLFMAFAVAGWSVRLSSETFEDWFSWVGFSGRDGVSYLRITLTITLANTFNVGSAVTL